MPASVFVYLFVCVSFAVAAVWLRFLRPSGAVVAALMGLTILSVGGFTWTVPPLTFFILSSILSKWAAGRRGGAEVEDRIQPRGHRRDAVQVLANGGVGWLVVAIFGVWPDSGLYWIFAASFAAAAADTWATEIGTAFRNRTRLIWTWEEVPPGTDGGVSRAGTIASVAGSISVIAISLPFGPLPLGAMPAGLEPAAVAALAGVAGSFIDSILGATVQTNIRFVTNDVVNILCTLTGAAVTAAILYS